MGHTDECYLCCRHRDPEDGGVDADGYGYHASCEAERQDRIARGNCWACNTRIREGAAVSDNAHEECMNALGHGEYVGF